jgi:hypothetical protein
MNEDIKRELLTKLSVALWPTAGKAVGTGKEATYAAARRGTFPGAYRVGKNWRAATPPLRRVLDLDEQTAA